jgi:uncharacterized protein
MAGRVAEVDGGGEWGRALAAHDCCRYKNPVAFIYDPAKDAKNQAEHGLSFAQFVGFDAAPLVLIDDRSDYGEERFRSFGMIDGKAYCVVFTMRGETMRLISFRRAHSKEMRRHDRK